eukprot:scaffold1366_cov155-Skeletonema_menzelii.AAC.22
MGKTGPQMQGYVFLRSSTHKGHKDMAVNQDVKDVGGCSVSCIAHAIYTKVKAGSESSSSVEEG